MKQKTKKLPFCQETKTVYVSERTYYIQNKMQRKNESVEKIYFGIKLMEKRTFVFFGR